VQQPVHTNAERLGCAQLEGEAHERKSMHVVSVEKHNFRGYGKAAYCQLDSAAAISRVAKNGFKTKR